MKMISRSGQQLLRIDVPNPPEPVKAGKVARTTLALDELFREEMARYVTKLDELGLDNPFIADERMESLQIRGMKISAVSS